MMRDWKGLGWSGQSLRAEVVWEEFGLNFRRTKILPASPTARFTTDDPYESMTQIIRWDSSQALWQSRAENVRRATDEEAVRQRASSECPL
jgi:hypothetical protein